MNPKPRPRWLSAAAIGAVIALGAAMLTAPVAAHPDESGSSSGESNPAVYIIGDRVVAIRRDRVPPGAYGGHGVDYSPNLTAWVLDSDCGDHGSVRTP